MDWKEKISSDSSLSKDPDLNTECHETLLTLLREKDSELTKMKEQLEVCHKQLAIVNSENVQLKGQIDDLCSRHEDEKKRFEDKSRHTPVASVSVQVSEESIDTECQDKPMPEWNDFVDANTSSIADILRETVEGEIQNQEKDESISLQYDGVHNQQSETNVSSEYIYDSNSGFYYHPATGYYWDPSSGLFYDYTSGLYYCYNEKTGEYEVHSNADGQKPSITNKILPTGSPLEKTATIKVKQKDQKDSADDKLRRRAKRRSLKEKTIRDSHSQAKAVRKYIESCLVEDGKTVLDSDINKDFMDEDKIKLELPDTQEGQQMDYESDSSGSLASGESELVSEIESGELISSSEDSNAEIIEDCSDFNYANHEEEPNSEAAAEDYPPCIRFIIQASESLPIGALYIVTCSGGSIGRDASLGHALLIPDSNVSKNHANITYDYEEFCYMIEDLRSQNGTFINEQRLSQSKKKSSIRVLSHCDVLQIGIDTKLLVHIHKGHETCDDCEPGQVQAKLKANTIVKNTFQVLSKEERKVQQRQELKRIKKKFGLQNSYFENPGATMNKSEYEDKATTRRKLVGSENDVIKTERPASVHSPITASNKGHKLLAKMGWKEGEGLGKSCTGIAEPIHVELRLNQKSGLGSGEAASLSIDNLQQASKVKRWNQARQRFHKLTTNNYEPETSVPVNQSKSGACLTGAQNRSNYVPSHPTDISTVDSNEVPSSSIIKQENKTQNSGISWIKGDTQQPP